MNKKLKVYFTCALSGLPLEHRQKMMAFRDSLSDVFEILEFCDPKEISDQEIYRFDIHHNVAEADLMLAIVDERGIGLGYEMGTMIEKHGKPVFAVAHRDAMVSPFVRGIDHSNYEFARYDNISDVRQMFLAFTQKHFPTILNI